MSKNFTIYFYVFASILVLIALIIESEILLLLSRPAIVPSLIVYYVFSPKKTKSKALMIILILSFISDTIELLKFQNFTDFIMIIDIIPYLILLVCLLNDLRQLTIKKENILFVLLVFFVLMFCLLCLTMSIPPSFSRYEIPVLFFGVIIALNVSFSLYMYLVNPQDYSMYILLATILFLIADIIYVVNSMIFYVRGLFYIEVIVHIISLFYIVSYFLKRNENKINYLR